jgi:hypothetical protein
MDAQLAKLYEQEAIELGIRMDVMLDRLAEIVGVMAESGPLPYEAARPIINRLSCAKANVLAAAHYVRANAEAYQQVKITDADEGVLL